MTVATENTFREMRHHLGILQEALEALSTTADEDRPTRDDVVVAWSLSDAVLAARGLLEEAQGAADEACRAVAYPLDTDRARRALTACQERLHHFAHHFTFELASYDRLDDLRSVGEERGAAWLKWVGVVRQALEQCQVQVEGVRNALFSCWQELAERIVAGGVSVRNTTIGQQITMPGRGADENLRADIA
jgi:hypothetical protein